jgi:hypothetical protein
MKAEEMLYLASPLLLCLPASSGIILMSLFKQLEIHLDNKKAPVLKKPKL